MPFILNAKEFALCSQDTCILLWSHDPKSLDVLCFSNFYIQDDNFSNISCLLSRINEGVVYTNSIFN